MPFELKVVDPAIDFPELIECEWISFDNPYQSFFRLFGPIIGSGPTAREDSLKECTSRQLQWHQSDPTSHWQKVIDTESGKIVGGALWKVCETNPFEHDEDHEVYWYPEGGQRDFAAGALKRFDAPRKKMAPRPQLYLNLIYTHPDYRRRGVGHMILEWGIKKATEMGVEIWLDATVHGVPVYKKHGFSVVSENSLVPEPVGEPDEDWKKIEKELGPMTLWPMVRKLD